MCVGITMRVTATSCSCFSLDFPAKLRSAVMHPSKTDTFESARHKGSSKI